MNKGSLEQSERISTSVRGESGIDVAWQRSKNENKNASPSFPWLELGFLAPVNVE